jgi:hypothetical protein
MTANQATYFDEPCTICQGRGVITQDDVFPCPSCGTKNRIPMGVRARCGKCHGAMTGALPITVECPYCEGYKTSGWALRNQVDDANHRSWLRRAVGYIPIVWMIRLIWGAYARTPGHQARRLFTTQEEVNTVRLASQAATAGFIFKQSMNQHHRHQAQAQQAPPGSYYNQAPGTWSPYAPGSPQPGPAWSPGGPQPGWTSPQAPNGGQQFYFPPHHGNAHQAQADQWNYQFNPSHHNQPPQASHAHPHNPYADSWNDRYNPSHHHPGQK